MNGRDDNRPGRTPRAAFEQGMKAYRRGVPFSDNRYLDHPLWSELAPRWSDGWLEAKAIDD